jgi:hypothetical protein
MVRKTLTVTYQHYSCLVAQRLVAAEGSVPSATLPVNARHVEVTTLIRQSSADPHSSAPEWTGSRKQSPCGVGPHLTVPFAWPY